MDTFRDKAAEDFIRVIESALQVADGDNLRFIRFTPSIEIGRRYLGVYDKANDRHFAIELKAIER